MLTPWVAASRLPLEEAPGAGEAEAATGAVEVTGVTEVTVTEGAVATAAEVEGEDSLQHSIVDAVAEVAEAAEVEAGIAAVVVAAEAIER